MILAAKSNLKDAAHNWLYSDDLRYFVTLTFKDDINELKARKELDLFCLRFNRLIFGRRSKRKIKIISILEFTADGNPHFHILFNQINNLNDNQVKDYILECWGKSFYIETKHLLGQSNSGWFHVIEKNTQDEVLSYCLKKIKYDINNLAVKHL